MKLLTIKQIKNGSYRDVDLNKTLTALVIKLYLPISTLVYMLYIIAFQPSKTMASYVTIALIISYFLLYPIGYYFTCCETYINKFEVKDEFHS